MAFFEWDQTDEVTYRADGYCIERIRAGKILWWLRFDDRTAVPAGFRSGAVDWKYNSLSTAKAAAIHVEMQRRRRVKIMRHAFLATVFALIALVVFTTFSELERGARLAAFVIGMATAGLAVREMGHGLIMYSSGSWDYLYEAPRVTRMDTFVARFLAHVMANPRPPDPEQESRVRIVPTDET